MGGTTWMQIAYAYQSIIRLVLFLFGLKYIYMKKQHTKHTLIHSIYVYKKRLCFNFYIYIEINILQSDIKGKALGLSLFQ